MSNPALLVLAVVAAAHICLVSCFQPGSDYNISKTTNLYNCTGRVHASNVTAPNSADTLPQTALSGNPGWEQWSLIVYGTFPIILRWSHSASDTTISPCRDAQFDVLVANINGTTVQRQVTDTCSFSYTDSKDVKQIKIGRNSLTWDSDAQWYNVSVDTEDYQMTLNSFSAMLETFHPNYDFHNGALTPIIRVDTVFGSVPLLRGHVVGSLSTPSNQHISLSGLSVMKHMFSAYPLHYSIDRYASATVWGHSTQFYDTHVFYRINTVHNKSAHTAAFLGRALPKPGEQGDFSSAWATYAVTNDPHLYNLTIDPSTNQIQVNASLSGCASTNDVPYQFYISSMTPLGEICGSNGITSYYTITNGSTTAFFEGEIKQGTIAGLYEEFHAW